MSTPPQAVPVCLWRSWAAANLGHLPGRCPQCGAHVEKQDHDHDCPAGAA